MIFKEAGAIGEVRLCVRVTGADQLRDVSPVKKNIRKSLIFGFHKTSGLMTPRDKWCNIAKESTNRIAFWGQTPKGRVNPAKDAPNFINGAMHKSPFWGKVSVFPPTRAEKAFTSV